MASYTVNQQAVARARQLIDARQYVLKSVWSDVQPSADDENAFLESHSWEEYAQWHLALTDGASDTYLARRGVCRDYAHLTMALLRARGIPARLVACYAPGLSPMDFHAVVEAAVDGRWVVLDPTRLAPRSSLVRISTGTDAAETSFLTVHTGGLTFGGLTVTAVVEGEDLPVDDHGSTVAVG